MVAANSSFQRTKSPTRMITDMKFQSLMAGIMHGTRLPARAALAAVSAGVFLPTEIVESIGKSAADWDEVGWD